MNTILAIDEGTTGTTALLMDTDLNPIAEASVDFPQHFPKPGWVEHELDDIWNAVLKTVREVVSKTDPKTITAIGITNQRETICFWDKTTQAPLGRALVWQDRRTADACAKLKSRGLEDLFHDRTGLLLDPYFSGTKVAWALENWGDVSRAAKSGKLAVGTIDSYLTAKISGGAAHVTEPSNASRTLCYNIKSRQWDPELCKELGIPLEIWPEVRPSAGLFAKTKGFAGLPDGIPISGILGDQQSALLGQACLEDGMAKCTYGTGAFILMNTGAKPVISHHRLLTTIAWDFGDGKLAYALEGSAFIAGAAIQWLRDGLGIINSSAESETLAASVDSTDGVVFVPALTGLGAPHWDPHATGLFTGLTRGTTKAHLTRAVLEGIAYQIADILSAMQKDIGKPLVSLNVDGGAAANNLLMQFQSDILGVSLRRPKFLETTSLGAIFAAGLGVKAWKDPQEIKKTWKIDREFTPKMGAQERKNALTAWTTAVAKAKSHG